MGIDVGALGIEAGMIAHLLSYSLQVRPARSLQSKPRRSMWL